MFRERGEGRYSLELLPASIVFEVDRLRRHSHELWGELLVTAPQEIAKGRSIESGILSIGDLNFSSVAARGTRAKLLKELAPIDSLDWHTFLEEFAYKVIAAERTGKPVVVLADIEANDEEDDADSWEFEGFPILKRHPMILFGKGGGGKSYLAMWVAGKLAQSGVPVLYADWEFSGLDHRKRLAKLFQPMPRDLHYVRCERPLKDEVERLRRVLQAKKCGYIVCDSIGPACDKRPEDAENANEYFRAVRQFPVGSLHIAHPPKGSDDDDNKRRPRVFGSAFFEYMARSIWFCQKAELNPKGELRLGLYHEKFNTGERLKPRALRFVFDKTTTRVERIEVKSVDELASKLPLLERIQHYLAKGPQTIKRIAEDLDSTPPVIRKTITRHASLFARVGPKGEQYGLASYDLEF